MNFESLLDPLSPVEFLASTYGKSARRWTGESSRFASLFTWADLNRVLRFHQLEAPRIRLIQQGQELSLEDFLARLPSRRGPDRPWLSPPAVYKALAAGATLVLTDLQEIHQPLAEFAEALERGLREMPRINAYVAFGSTPGTRPHADPQDIFALQLYGEKKWSLRDPSIVDDKARVVDSGENFEMRPGDVLYLPRGWIHSVEPSGGPSMHLAVGIQQPTARELLDWHSRVASKPSSLDQSLLWFDGQESLDSTYENLAAVLREALTLENVEAFMRARDAVRPAAPEFSLPYVPQMAASPHQTDALPRDARLRPTSPRFDIVPGPDAESRWIVGIGRKWQTASKLEAVLGPILGGVETVVSDALRGLEQSGIDSSEGERTLHSLVVLGVLSVH